MSRFSKLAACIRLLSSVDPKRVHHRLTSGGFVLLAASYLPGMGKDRYGSNSLPAQPVSSIRPAPEIAAATARATTRPQPTMCLTPLPPYADTMAAPVPPRGGTPASPSSHMRRDCLVSPYLFSRGRGFAKKTRGSLASLGEPGSRTLCTACLQSKTARCARAAAYP